MDDPGLSPGGRPWVARLAFPVRRALAPAALELGGQVQELAAQLQDLGAEVDRLREEHERRQAAADEREGALLRRVEAQEARMAELREEVLEGRRLNVRIAELTDLVTELVLPLHDRDIDPAALRVLRPDTV